MRTTLFVAVLSAGLSLGAGCKKADDKAGAGSAAGSGGATAVATGTGAGATPDKAGAASAIPQATGDDLSLLPAKAEVVMSINFQQVQTSALWKQLVEPQILKNMDKLEKYKAKCGINPLEAFKSITLGLDGMGSSSPTGAIVIHGLDKAKTLDCFDKMKEDIAAQGTEITKDGEFVIMKDKNGVTSTASFVNADTMLVAVGGDKAKLGEYAKGGSSLKTSPAFVDMFGKINNTHTMWALARGDSKMFEAAAQAGIKLKAVYGSINVTDSVTVAGRVRMDSPDAATQLATMANGKVGQIKGFVDKLDVTTDGSDVKLDAAASAEKLKTLMSMAQGMGAMGGGEPAEAPAAPAAP